MEKGTVKSFDKSCGMGMISRLTDEDLKFYEDSVIGKGRAGLKQGDSVSFELSNIKNFYIAINVRKMRKIGF